MRERGQYALEPGMPLLAAECSEPRAYGVEAEAI